MTTRQTIKRFFEPVRENPIMWIGAIWQYFIFSVGPIISILFLRHITAMIELGDREAFTRGLIYFVIINIIYYVIRIINRNIGRVPIFGKGEKDIYKKYIPWFISLDNNAIEKIGTGRMVAIVQQGMSTWIALLSSMFNEGMDVILSLILVIYVLSTTNSLLIVYFMVALVVVQYIVYRLNIYILENKRLQNPLRNEYTRGIVRILMSKFEIMQQNKANEEVRKLDTNRDSFFSLTKKRSLYIELNYLIPTILVFLLYMAMFVIVGYGIFDGSYNFADLVLFASTIGLLNNSLYSVSDGIKDFFQDYNQVEHLREVFDNIPKNNYTSGNQFEYKKGNIMLNNITFGYEENKIFTDFSLNLIGGTKTAFVGESGGGKTTLIKLLAGYLRPDSGEIIIDGQKITEVKLTDYYRHIGYLTQEPSVFDGTIWENLTYALDMEKPTQSSLDREVKRIIKLAKCEFIYELAHGLQTEIGERGVRLSGGQKQRLAIAKIMLKNPNIILLDEPTSALDSFNEELVSEALNNLFAGRTVIVVAHRLQTVKNADRILYIEGGKVIEDGTHEQLISHNGKYKKMLDLQSGF